MVRRVLVALVLGACGRVGFAPATDGGGALALDGGDGDDAPVMGVCDVVADTDVVALYAFESDLTSELTGDHPAMQRGPASLTSGRCGSGAITFGTDGYLIVPNSPALELATGSIELFVRVPTPILAGDNQTLLGRDASGVTNEGHLALFLNTAGDLIVRLQRGGASYYRCAPVLPADTWVHIGASFGGTAAQGLRLWVDGVEASLPTSMLDGGPVDCAQPAPAGGLTGNSNALILGATNARGAEGDPAPLVDQFLVGGTLDQVRIRSTWRDFGAP